MTVTGALVKLIIMTFMIVDALKLEYYSVVRDEKPVAS